MNQFHLDILELGVGVAAHLLVENSERMRPSTVLVLTRSAGHPRPVRRGR